MGDDYNPYAAPDADVADPYRHGPGQLNHATRLARLGARIIDGILGSLVAIPLYPLIIDFQLKGSGISNPFNLTQDQMYMGAGIGGFLLLIFWGIQFYFLYESAQTIGKKAFGIKIVAEDGSPASFGKILGLRMFVMTLIEQIPLAGGIVALVNPLMIFRESQRCLHDDLAKTAVVLA
jgi:uncharacterized RDD family membrane protein YckC